MIAFFYSVTCILELAINQTPQLLQFSDAHRHCRWILKADRGEQIQLHIFGADLLPSQYLEVSVTNLVW